MIEADHVDAASHGHSYPTTAGTITQVALLQILTIGWMMIECSAALSAALRSHSAALLAFGSDSLVELLSAVIVLLQFSSVVKLNQKRAARLSGILLFVLAGVVTFTSLSALAHGSKVDVSLLGMVTTGGALLVMPVLALLKRRKARELNNRALAADAIQSADVRLPCCCNTWQPGTQRRVSPAMDRFSGCACGFTVTHRGRAHGVARRMLWLPLRRRTLSMTATNRFSSSTFAILQVGNSIKIYFLLGHVSLQTTERYLGLCCCPADECTFQSWEPR